MLGSIRESEVYYVTWDFSIVHGHVLASLDMCDFKCSLMSMCARIRLVHCDLASSELTQSKTHKACLACYNAGQMTY